MVAKNWYGKEYAVEPIIAPEPIIVAVKSDKKQGVDPRCFSAPARMLVAAYKAADTSYTHARREQYRNTRRYHALNARVERLQAELEAACSEAGWCATQAVYFGKDAERGARAFSDLAESLPSARAEVKDLDPDTASAMSGFLAVTRS